LENLILGTPARTLEGAVVQIRRVAASLAHNDGDAREQRGLRLALATLARLRGACPPVLGGVEPADGMSGRAAGATTPCSDHRHWQVRPSAA
jgi:hypothetical protein